MFFFVTIYHNEIAVFKQSVLCYSIKGVTIHSRIAHLLRDYAPEHYELRRKMLNMKGATGG